MRYVGSKLWIAKYILPIILQDRTPDQLYIEPFCGGCNSMDKVDGLRLANDSNHYLIAMWRALQQEWIPPSEITEEQWRHVRYNRDLYHPALVAFVGIGCSFGAKWFEGYARGIGRNNVTYDYANSSKNVVLKQIKKLEGVVFTDFEFQDLPIQDFQGEAIIYCDPPYQNTVKYKDLINHDLFWKWGVERVSRHSMLLNLEYSQFFVPLSFP